MTLKVAIFVIMLSLAGADRPPIYGAPPTYSPPPPPPPPTPPTYTPPAPKYAPSSPYKEPEYPTEPPKYSYNYGVADDYSGANFGHSESRDGYKTEGSYTVNLPDGRIQTVTYVDNGDGLIAEVTYQGEAQYPEYKPEYKPAPSYKPKPAPSYKPEPPYPAPLPPPPSYP